MITKFYKYYENVSQEVDNDDDIAQWVLGKLEKDGMDERNLNYENKNGLEKWTYHFVEFHKDDPYGEENWENTPKHRRFYFTVERKNNKSYRMYITNDLMYDFKASKDLIKKIIYILEEPKRREAIERKNREKEFAKRRRENIRKDLFW